MSKDTFTALMLGIFIPLGVFSVWSAVTLWRVVALPAIRSGGVWRYAVGVGGALVSTALAMECVTYGLIRWDPQNFGWLNTTYEWVLLPKVIYLMGILTIQTASAKEERRERLLMRLLVVAAAMWVAGSAFALWRM